MDIHGCYPLSLNLKRGPASKHQELREDPEALLAARMGVRIRGAGGLQYFKWPS